MPLSKSVILLWDLLVLELEVLFSCIWGEDFQFLPGPLNESKPCVAAAKVGSKKLRGNCRPLFSLPLFSLPLFSLPLIDSLLISGCCISLCHTPRPARTLCISSRNHEVFVLCSLPDFFSLSPRAHVHETFSHSILRYSSIILHVSLSFPSFGSLSPSLSHSLADKFLSYKTCVRIVIFISLCFAISLSVSPSLVR